MMALLTFCMVTFKYLAYEFAFLLNETKALEISHAQPMEATTTRLACVVASLTGGYNFVP